MVCILRLAYDETGQQMTVPYGGNHTRPEQQAGVWQIMVVRLHVAVGWWSGNGAVQVCQFEVVMPAFLVPSPSAEHIYRTFFSSRPIR